jgi:hypothetical protein
MMADRSADEVKTLRLAARDRAAVCADCFALLAPAASITMKWRFVEHVTKRTFDAYAPEREGCSRPMRVEVRRLHRLTHREQCCCEQCFRAVYRRRNNARRRVVPEPRACIVCGTVFTPRKSNATTCSGKCRVKKMRGVWHTLDAEGAPGRV